MNVAEIYEIDMRYIYFDKVLLCRLERSQKEQFTAEDCTDAIRSGARRAQYMFKEIKRISAEFHADRETVLCLGSLQVFRTRIGTVGPEGESLNASVYQRLLDWKCDFPITLDAEVEFAVERYKQREESKNDA